jgi:hypothetical protein
MALHDGGKQVNSTTREFIQGQTANISGMM